MHSKKREEDGECCQQSNEQDNAQQLTYEYTVKIPEQKQMSEGPEIRCTNCNCVCHCSLKEHSNWGGEPSQFSGVCDCNKCEHEEKA